MSGQSVFTVDARVSGPQKLPSIIWVSCTPPACHFSTMGRPQRIDLEFAILPFVVGGGMVYSPLRGVFAMLG